MVGSVSEDRRGSPGVTRREGASSAAHVMALLKGIDEGRAVTVAVELGVFEELRQGQKLPVEIAAGSGCDARAMERLLRVLQEVDLVEKDAAGTFALTAAGQLLCDGAGSLRPIATYVGAAWRWEAWGELAFSIRTGLPGFDQAMGRPLFDYLEDDPDAAEIFHRRAGRAGRMRNLGALESYDFAAASLIVDIGGGVYSLLEDILASFPAVRGVLVDLPHVAEAASRRIARRGLSDRCEVVGGDALVAVPGGGNLYILAWVLADFTDDDVVRILSNCRESMAPDAGIVIVEDLIDTVGADTTNDLDILVLVGGQQRDAAGYEGLVRRAGLRVTTLRPFARTFTLIEVRKPDSESSSDAKENAG